MRVLVTGGAGFIGSHMCDLLLEEGHAVQVLDDLSTGSAENVSHLEGREGFRFTLGSVDDDEVVDELVAEADVVVHLAAAVGVKLVVDSPVRAIETNVHCTEVVLAHADRHKRPVLLASTSEVYGKSAALPFSEDGDLQLGATDKWRERGLPVIVVRLFNTVGPRQTGSYGMVVPTLVGQALAGDALSVYGDGRQTRCFCHVADVVRALDGLLNEPRAYGNVFNVGATAEISILELARRIIAVTGSGSEVSLTTYADAYGDGFEDMYRRIPDTSKLHGLIGWAPTRSLDDVIRDVMAHQQRAPA
jgi:UDP-glucose 4-epimerase